MGNIVDRRYVHNQNKNVSNRKRYIDRVKDEIRESVSERIQNDKLKDLAKGDKIVVKGKDTSEPSFNQDWETGDRDIVAPGNRNFEAGDSIAKPRKGGGSRGRKGDLSDDGEDSFSFTLSRDEFMDILFEDLELPELVKRDIKGAKVTQPERRGYTTSGSPNNLDVVRTFKNSLGRKIALNRPSKEQLAKLVAELELETDEVRKLEIQSQIDKMLRKRKAVPYLDSLDVRYRRFDKIPKPVSNAVMFCLMDVSGSMGEKEKDIAKRFFLLLYLFLNRKYENVEVVFVRHTTHAEEVDEQTFFHDRLSGGTQISTGLDLIDKLIDARYDLEKTNIYIAQASDGGNYDEDNITCRDIINDRLLAKVQYFAYIEIVENMQSHISGLFQMSYGEQTSLWSTYTDIMNANENFQIRAVSHRREIYQVFADLFRKKSEESK